MPCIRPRFCDIVQLSYSTTHSHLSTQKTEQRTDQRTERCMYRSNVIPTDVRTCLPFEWICRDYKKKWWLTLMANSAETGRGVLPHLTKREQRTENRYERTRLKLLFLFNYFNLFKWFAFSLFNYLSCSFFHSLSHLSMFIKSVALLLESFSPPATPNPHHNPTSNPFIQIPLPR